MGVLCLFKKKKYLFHFENSSILFLFTVSDMMHKEEKVLNKTYTT